MKTWLICENGIDQPYGLTIFIKDDDHNDDAWHKANNLTINACEKHTISLLLLWKSKKYSLAPNYPGVFNESFTRILVPRIYIEIYSAYDKLSVTVGKNSSEHEQGLHPK